jgi:hypothetical protein
MLADLGDWTASLREVRRFFDVTVQELERGGYWTEVDWDFRNLVHYSIKFFDTSTDEITAVAHEMGEEVRHDHVKRLRQLFNVARELNREYGTTWHRDYTNKEYGKSEFRKVEELYARGRDMAVDMLDLSNLATRLEDFVGQAARRKRFSWLMMKPNFYGIGIDFNRLLSRRSRR